VKDEAIGAIALDNLSRTGAFDESDLRLLTLFASSAAVAIENARLFQETRRRAGEREVLYEATRDLSSHFPNLATLLTSLVHKAARLMGSHGSGMYLYDPDREEIEMVAASEWQRDIRKRLKLGEGAAGKVAQTRAPLVLEDYQAWEGRRAALDGLPYRALLEVPMLYSGELVGILDVYEYGDSLRQYNEADLKLLSLFASQAAGALHSARLFEQISHRASEFEALYQTAADLSSQTNVQALLDTVMQRARGLMNAAGAVVYLFDAENSEVELRASSDPDLLIGTRLALGEGLSGKVAQTKQPMIVRNYREWDGRSPKYERFQYTSVVGVPMLYSGQLIGVLNVFNLAERDSQIGRKDFTARDASLLELLANFTAGAVYVARLLEQTRRRVDQLSALHAIDTAIGSTTDPRVSLQAVLDGAIRQLGVDAADVLLLNPSTLMLQYSAGSGFFTAEINRTICPLGTGQAGRAALERRIAEVPDLTAPGNGFTRAGLVTAERFKAYVCVPLLAKGEVKGVLELFHRAPIRFDEERRSLLEVLAGQAALAIDNAQLFEGLERANLELTMAYDATIEGWSQALELRDQETQGHSSRVLELTLSMASAIGLPDWQLRDIRRGVLLHDIGKMGVPDSILHKQGPLTPEEWQIMRQHPQYAFNMLAPIVYLRNALDIPYAHHERWNGQGYPRGLKGDTIPLPARIFSVVDVYDALISDRPYRKAWSEEKTLEYIVSQSGEHFDPQIVEIFLAVIRNR
jgi:HD-GYP domain-containing protein (c-di-GMP phosphodiesterase class II)